MGETKREALLAGIRADLQDLFTDLVELSSCHESLRDQLEVGAFSSIAAPKLPLGSSAIPNPIDEGCYAAPVMAPEEIQRMTVTLEEAPKRLREVMQEHGVAVVTGVVSPEELEKLEEDFKSDLMDLVDEAAVEQSSEGVRNAFRRFDEQGPRAFPLRTVTEYLTHSAGFCLERCLAHGRFAWKIRRHPNVHAAFRELFPGEGEDLVTSLDVTFFTPEGQKVAQRNGFSAHTDQNRSDARPGLGDCHTYQGSLYVWPAGQDGRCSTTTVWPGSHRSAWPDMMQDMSFFMSGAQGFHYSEITMMADQARARALASGWAKHARRVVAPAGSLLLWNSRTMHAGWKGGPRLAQAVCLEPATRRPTAERVAKMRLAALGLPGCHWASAAMQHDMSLGAPGYFARDGVRAKDGAGRPDQVVLPLKKALRPAALADSADEELLAKLVHVNYRFVGMWDPHEGCEELLEASLKEDYKLFL